MPICDIICRKFITRRVHEIFYGLKTGDVDLLVMTTSKVSEYCLCQQGQRQHVKKGGGCSNYIFGIMMMLKRGDHT